MIFASFDTCNPVSADLAIVKDIATFARISMDISKSICLCTWKEILESHTYRKRENILLIYRGMLFLLERRFETFMNVILFKQIIQDNVVENLSEDILFFALFEQEWSLPSLKYGELCS